MNAVEKMFQFEGKNVESVWDDANQRVLFRASEVCEVLEYANTRDAVAKHVDPKDVVKRDTLTAGGKQQVNYLTLEGVLALINRSDMSKALEFQRFMTGTVMPAVIINGQYVAPQAVQPPQDRQMAAIELAQRMMMQLPNIIPERVIGKTLLTIERTTGVSMSDYKQLLTVSHDDVINLTPTEVGEMIGMSGIKTNLLLGALGYQTKSGKKWLLTDKAKGLGAVKYTEGGNYSKEQNVWSQKIVEILKNS